MTVAELATATGLHGNTAREHLHSLIDAGFVTSEPIRRTTKGRPQILYRAATQPGDSVRRAKLHAAQVRTEQFRSPSRFRADDASGTSLDRQLDLLDDHMEQCGFNATISADASRMTMRDCPFSGLVKANPQVCEVHFALVKDALELGDGPLGARDMHPHSGPHECVVDLELDTPHTP